MKQTAVDFLYKFLYEMESFEGFDPYNFNQEEVFAKAKAMEKEQIIESWDNGYANGYDLGKYNDEPNPDDAEQYYNETFKSE